MVNILINKKNIVIIINSWIKLLMITTVWQPYDQSLSIKKNYNNYRLTMATYQYACHYHYLWLTMATYPLYY